jgi:starch synthase
VRILLASSEVYPYSKTGGLADVVGALGKSLAEAGHRVGVVTPLYAGVRERYPALKRLDWGMHLPHGQGYVSAEVWTLEPVDNLTLYFIAAPFYYERRKLYGEAGDYPDNAARFIYLAKAAAHLARYLPWRPEVLHVHDWQTAIAPLLVRHQALREGWQDPPKTCLTIHNLAYQGRFAGAEYAWLNLPLDYFNPAGVEFFGDLNCLKAGIIYADALTTVSARYAQEITTPEFGCHLETVLRPRRAALSGILNGADYSEWKTVKNPALPHAYSAKQWRGKALDKLALQKELGLPAAPAIPLFGNVGRLAEQKGIDILVETMEALIEEPLQFVLLGQGQPEYEAALSALAARYPDKVAVRIGFHESLPHRILAGCDFSVMPSRFEPCGLTQMYSLRYGTIPIVRATGGLDDSIIDLTEQLDKANGIKFREYSSRALTKAIRKGMALYGEELLLKHYRQNGLKADFSWARTAAAYLKVYEQMLAPSAPADLETSPAPPEPAPAAEPETAVDI